MASIPCARRSAFSWVTLYLTGGMVWAALCARIYGQTQGGDVLRNLLLWPVALGRHGLTYLKALLD
jgi:hypothetical protein